MQHDVAETISDALCRGGHRNRRLSPGDDVKELLAHPSRSLLTGPLGSTIALASPAGAITTRYHYSPYGAVTATGSTSSNTFEFNATQNDRTGLYLMGARYYNLATATFTSQDPLGLAGGSTNLYQYTNNDPINLSDPTGCYSQNQCIAAAAAGGAVGGGACRR